MDLAHAPRILSEGAIIAKRFEVVRRIGDGGQGSVFEAIDLASRRRVALKVVRPGAEDESVSRARLRREGHAIARVRSPHVIEVIDVLELPDGAPCVVMELLEGRSLREAMRGGTPSLARAITWARGIARGLAAIHAAGLVHRDVKPSNVYLARVDEAEVVKLLDFGIVKSAADGSTGTLTTGDQVLGTLSYMAPEQMCASASVDGRCDVWSLGVVLYELVSGERPFGAPNEPAVVAQILSGVAPRLKSVAPHVPDALDELVAACLAYDPVRRVASAAAVEAQLAALQESPHELAAPQESTRTQPPLCVPDSSPDDLTLARTRPGQAVPERGVRTLLASVALVAVLAIALPSAVGAMLRVRRGPAAPEATTSAPVAMKDARGSSLLSAATKGPVASEPKAPPDPTPAPSPPEPSTAEIATAPPAASKARPRAVVVHPRPRPAAPAKSAARSVLDDRF